MNHSCDPNAAVGSSSADALLTVKAKKRIMKGDEICFDYIKVAGIPVAMKRELLLSKYHFLCRCKICQQYEDEQSKLEAAANATDAKKPKPKSKNKNKNNKNKKKKRK
eukprot:TRINITY_DN3211_c0_g1_i1.p1 TRINITY_DN3211_c0_g1~~TRINITY_DN3211_c0_g1_i1.p1  ORF type:complete len:108 (-),score=37.57 TRINITY_DN3211_c0_g1_i1:6-329(-)